LNDLIADHEERSDATLLAVAWTNPSGMAEFCSIIAADLRELRSRHRRPTGHLTINSRVYCLKRSFLAEALPRLTAACQASFT
jgi:hypothetical protein